jgi:SAM-dependent methyltransferase
MSELYTFVAHRGLPFANPFSEASMERAVEVLALAPGAAVADFGAGSCELAVRLAERCQARVAAVELSKRMAALAREKVHARLVSKGLPGGVTVHEGDAGTFRTTMEPGSFDLTVCIGSTHALGGLEKTVKTLRRLTRAGGQVLIGEGFWRRRPPRAYLETTGMHAEEFLSYTGTVELALGEQLTPIWSITASEREWDEYEWAHGRNIEEYAAGRGVDNQIPLEMLRRSRRWRQAYWRWGRRTLGFGLFLYRVQ